MKTQLNQADIIRHLLSDHQGIVMGEAHHKRGALKVLIDNMELLSELGVKTLGLEIFKSEWSDETLAHFNQTGGMDMPDQSDYSMTLKDRITFLDFKYASQEHPMLKGKGVPLTSLRDAYLFTKKNAEKTDNPTVNLVSELMAHEDKQSYNYRALLEKAHACGIHVLAIDSKNLGVTDKALSAADTETRKQQMDGYAAQRIKQHAGEGKFITLSGAIHTQGISALLGVPDVHVMDMPREAIYTERPYTTPQNETMTPDYLLATRSRAASNHISIA